MESLPLELIVNIVSRLSLEQQVKCRLVSKTLKDAVDCSFKSTTHIALDEVILEDRLALPHYLEENYVFCNLKYSANLINSLASTCPNLQVLYARNSTIQVAELVPLGQTLKFFLCNNLLIDIRPDEWIKSFRQLEAFDYLNIFHDSIDQLHLSELLIKKCLDQNKSLYNIMVPSNTILKHLIKTNSYKSIKSICINQKDGKVTIPAIIATNLRSFRLRGTDSLVLELEAPLSNLEYYCSFWFLPKDNSIYNKLFNSQKLKFICCFFSCFSPSLVERLITDLQSQKKLKYFEYTHNPLIYESLAGPKTFLKIALPPKMEKFHITHNHVHLEITGGETLRGLKCNNIYRFNDKLLNLEELTFDTNLSEKFLNEHGIELSNFITSCVNLKELNMTFHKQASISSYQRIINSIQTLEKLETVFFNQYYYSYCDLEKIHTKEAVSIDLSKLSSVKMFVWRLPDSVNVSLPKCSNVESDCCGHKVKVGTKEYIFYYGKSVNFIQ